MGRRERYEKEKELLALRGKALTRMQRSFTNGKVSYWNVGCFLFGRHVNRL